MRHRLSPWRPHAMRRTTLVFLILLGAVPRAQDADSEGLRQLTKAAPLLPADQIELRINPPLTLEGISAVAADKQGNIYVIHRPKSGDPVVVLDAKGNLLRSW